MKKKHEKQPSAPTKEFSSAPFKSLRGFLPDAPKEPVRKTVPPPAPVKPVDEDDSALFLQAMADVRPVVPRKRDGATGSPSAHPAKPILRKIAEEERQTFLKALEKLELDVTFRDELHEDDLLHQPRATNRMRQLRRGTIRIDYELDLHGLTREEALDHLSRFITSAVNRTVKAVLVITGRGNHSEGEPVLQGAVTAWLRDAKALVAEFAPAPREMGGNGAFVVFLKDKAKEQSPLSP